MKIQFVTIILIVGTATLFTVSVLDQFNLHGTQISKEECMGGSECPGSTPIPSASIGNRTIEVALKLYSNSTTPSNVHYLWLKFFDAKTNQAIQHISFFLNITENNYSVLHDTFNAPAGILTLQVNSIGSSFNGTVIGDREPILNAWMPHDDEPVVVYAPVFNDANSTYHMNITMDTIDKDNNMFTDQGIAPRFDFYLNMKGQNQTITSPNVTVPEFTFAVPILLIGSVSMIIFYRMNIRK
ncbi:MAG TPA: hypothetical protein VJ771_06095 [Candidatus Nitrosotalea sp.]|nr:hypothetical protein [Candidatus Nitrosotalea sp.]